MPKILEKILLILTDFFLINLTFYLWTIIRDHLGFYVVSNPMFNLYISLLIFIFWFFLFIFLGLYRSWYAQSRFDEFVAIFKTATVGAFIGFVVTMDVHIDLQTTPSFSRLLFVGYWILLIFFVSSGRIILRTVQRKLLEFGIGRRKTLIVGWNEKAQEFPLYSS